MNFGLTLLHSERPKLYAILAFLSAIGEISHQRGHGETRPQFKVQSEGPEKQGIEFVIPGLAV